MFAILPYQPEHLAQLAVQAAQVGDCERLGLPRGAAAELGPAFTAAELDGDGRVMTVLGCAGLAEHPGGERASAWASFAEGLRPAQWSALTAAIRRVLDQSGYRLVDVMVRPDFPAAQRYAEALGFEQEAIVYLRRDEPLLRERAA